MFLTYVEWICRNKINEFSIQKFSTLQVIRFVMYMAHFITDPSLKTWILRHYIYITLINNKETKQ